MKTPDVFGRSVSKYFDTLRSQLTRDPPNRQGFFKNVEGHLRVSRGKKCQQEVLITSKHHDHEPFTIVQQDIFFWLVGYIGSFCSRHG